MGMVGTVKQTPENTRRRDPGETATTAPKYSGTGPPVYQSTHCGGTLTEPMGTIATAMRNITPETQIKNTREIFNLLATQDSDLWGLNRDDTLFTALLVEPVNHQVKVV